MFNGVQRPQETEDDGGLLEAGLAAVLSIAPTAFWPTGPDHCGLHGVEPGRVAGLAGVSCDEARVLLGPDVR